MSVYEWGREKRERKCVCDRQVCVWLEKPAPQTGWNLKQLLSPFPCWQFRFGSQLACVGKKIYISKSVCWTELQLPHSFPTVKQACFGMDERASTKGGGGSGDRFWAPLPESRDAAILPRVSCCCWNLYQELDVCQCQCHLASCLMKPQVASLWGWNVCLPKAEGRHVCCNFHSNRCKGTHLVHTQDLSRVVGRGLLRMDGGPCVLGRGRTISRLVPLPRGRGKSGKVESRLLQSTGFNFTWDGMGHNLKEAFWYSLEALLDIQKLSYFIPQFLFHTFKSCRMLDIGPSSLALCVLPGRVPQGFGHGRPPWRWWALNLHLLPANQNFPTELQLLELRVWAVEQWIMYQEAQRL